MLPAIANFTSLPAKVWLRADHDARQFYVVVVGATFEAQPGAALRLAQEQVPLQEVDLHYASPQASSVRYDADLADEKHWIDIVVNGHAHAPAGTTVERTEVALEIEGALRKRLIVWGDRFRRAGGSQRSASSARPFRTMPVLYERAFGGSSAAAHYAANPVGLGFHGARSADETVESEVPNIESAEGQSNESVPGFGVVARSWVPRIRWAGTYGERWLREQFPLVPHDFDARFHQSAPPDQQVRVLAGKTVTLTQMTPQGRWAFRVPDLDVPVHLRHADGAVALPMRLDTLIVEPDQHRFTVRARARAPVRRLEAPLAEVVVGQATPAWWLARLSRKRFFAGPGRDGRRFGANSWHG